MGSANSQSRNVAILGSVDLVRAAHEPRCSRRSLTGSLLRLVPAFSASVPMPQFWSFAPSHDEVLMAHGVKVKLLPPVQAQEYPAWRTDGNP